MKLRYAEGVQKSRARSLFQGTLCKSRYFANVQFSPHTITEFSHLSDGLFLSPDSNGRSSSAGHFEIRIPGQKSRQGKDALGKRRTMECVRNVIRFHSPQPPEVPFREIPPAATKWGGDGDRSSEVTPLLFGDMRRHSMSRRRMLLSSPPAGAYPLVLPPGAGRFHASPGRTYRWLIVQVIGLFIGTYFVYF